MSLSGATILQVIPHLAAGGAERTAIEVTEALTAAGARSLVASKGGRLEAELVRAGGELIRIDNLPTKNPLAIHANAGVLAKIAADRKVSLIHARSRAPAWSALWAARRLKLPFVTTYHGVYSAKGPLKRLYNSVMARGEVVIANSHFTAERIQAQFRMNPTCLRVIHRGTNFETFSPDRVSPARIEKIRRGWLVAPEERVVLLAGRLTPWKGQMVLIRAAQVLRERGYRDLVFILAGDPQGRDGYVREIDQLISENQLGGVVRRVGHVSDMPAALAASALVAVPSTAPEAFGRVAVEAQAMGVPVVVSNLGAVPETVLAPPQVRPDQRTGWRVAPDNPEELADAIAEAIDLMPSTFQELADRARAHVMARFSLERMVSETLDCYSALLAERQNR